jgi:uncharacterized membrane protein YdfJ with MMPL/SSD domain
VLVFWLIVLALTGPLAGKLMGAEKNDASAYLPASAESTQELNLQSKFTAKNLNPAVVVYVRPSGLTPADLHKAAADAKIFAALPAVHGRVAGPIPSSDHKAMQVIVGSSLGYNANIEGFINNLRATAARGDPGLTVHIAGPAASAADAVKIFKGIDTTLLYGTLAVIIVLLLITYRSPVLWLMPIISAGVSLTVAQAVIYLLTKHGLVVNGQSGGILVVLVLGASTDYALLLVARYREELRRHEDRHEAMAVALRRAGPAIIASAGTVIVGMLCLLVAESADISGLGPVAAIGIAVGLLAMITLLPALLVITGRWVFWPLRPRYGSDEPTTRGFWAGVGRRMAVRPRTVWVTTAVLLACAWLGLIGPATTVDRARAAVHAVPGANAKVGGATAINSDVERYATRDRNVIIPLVLLVVLLILGLLLRAVVAAFLLIGTVVLSFGAALGLSALLFRHVFGFAGADTAMPLFVFVFLVALGIDYNIFLMTRVREESKRHGTRLGAITGLGATGGVITSAGLILAGTFATLSTLPLVILTEIGVTVAIGVLIDTVIVRSVLVTALTLDIGRWMWWPSHLARPSSAEISPQEAAVVSGQLTAAR